MINTCKEMGGYLELESFRGKELYPNLHKLNLARTAFVWLLSHIPHEKVFLPEFICDTVCETATSEGYKLVSYRLDENLRPVWGLEGEPGPNDIFYLVNYNGILQEQEIIQCRNQYETVIVDNAQALFNKPVEGVHTIYSLRKFLGVADGAYVASDINASTEQLEQDISVDRVKYLVGRLEKTANDFYAESKSAELGFSCEKPKRMSLFTQNIIRGICYEEIAEKRCENYKTLDNLLNSENPFTKNTPTCPYLYPFYHEDGYNLRKYLLSKRIYIPTLWSFLLDEEHEGSLEYDWSKNILWLPIDQRYTEEDMRYLADTINYY